MNRTLGWALSIAVITAHAAVHPGHGAAPDDENGIARLSPVRIKSTASTPTRTHSWCSRRSQSESSL